MRTRRCAPFAHEVLHAARKMIERYEARETVVLKGEGLKVLENEESMQLDLAFEVLREGDALNTTDAIQLDALPVLQRPIHPAGILVGDLRDDQLQSRLDYSPRSVCRSVLRSSRILVFRSSAESSAMFFLVLFVARDLSSEDGFRTGTLDFANR